MKRASSKSFIKTKNDIAFYNGSIIKTNQKGVFSDVLKINIIDKRVLIGMYKLLAEKKLLKIFSIITDDDIDDLEIIKITEDVIKIEEDFINKKKDLLDQKEIDYYLKQTDRIKKILYKKFKIIIEIEDEEKKKKQREREEEKKKLEVLLYHLRRKEEFEKAKKDKQR